MSRRLHSSCGIVVPKSTPLNCFVQPSHDRQLERNGCRLVAGFYQILAAGDDVILRGGRRRDSLLLTPGNILGRLRVIGSDRRRASVTLRDVQPQESSKCFGKVGRVVRTTWSGKRFQSYVRQCFVYVRSPPFVIDISFGRRLRRWQAEVAFKPFLAFLQASEQHCRGRPLPLFVVIGAPQCSQSPLAFMPPALPGHLLANL